MLFHSDTRMRALLLQLEVLLVFFLFFTRFWPMSSVVDVHMYVDIIPRYEVFYFELHKMLEKSGGFPLNALLLRKITGGNEHSKSLHDSSLNSLVITNLILHTYMLFHTSTSRTSIMPRETITPCSFLCQTPMLCSGRKTLAD